MKPRIHWFLNNEGVNLLVTLLVLIIALLIVSEHKSGNMGWIDYTVFFTVILALFVNFTSIFINRVIIGHLEDDLKLTHDYDGLANKYEADFIMFDNELEVDVATDNLNRLKNLKDGKVNVTFPVILDMDLYGKEITIQDDPKEQYVLPADIQREFGHIFKAHDSSKIYNQLNIRINEWQEEEDQLLIYTGRTTYFNSLATNRAMDYKWTTGVTTRDLYGYGPYVRELSESELSNHLGFNGFIESDDEYIAFIRRGRNLSIAKGTYATSIAASLKVKYALNSDKAFTKEGLVNAIVKEIEDELKITEYELEGFSAEENIIAAYRDLVEGGKPQLLVYARANKSKDEIEKNFTKNIRNKGKDSSQKENVESQVLEDGNKILWIYKDDLRNLAISSEYMVHEGKEYKMVPSAAASVVMLRRHLEKMDEIYSNIVYYS